MRNGNLTVLTLAVLVLISAVAVIQIKHRNRELTARLDGLREEREKLDVEWAQLQLEQATLAQHGRVDQLARTQFGMVEPQTYTAVNLISEPPLPTARIESVPK